MARTTLYSRSPRRSAGMPTGGLTPEPGPRTEAAASVPPGTAAQAPGPEPTPARWRATLSRHERWAWALGALALATAAGWPAWHAKLPQAFTLEQIDAALRESLLKEPLPAVSAAAYDAVMPSVVRVVGLPADTAAVADAAGKPGAGATPSPKGEGQADARPPAPGADDAPVGHGRSVGTGVVIVNSGLILTNLHVVQGASRVKVTFFDGSESEASVVSTQPEHDLAVLQARVLPDDLHAATLRSTQGLSPGDAVVAVGFPYGIGPSASAGVVSGLKREFRSPKGQRILTNLIQFDAAANPGNSGGPLVTQDGAVVGIVTAIMNPEGHSTFIGIGFAVPIENAAAAVGMPPF